MSITHRCVVASCRRQLTALCNYRLQTDVITSAYISATPPPLLLLLLLLGARRESRASDTATARLYKAVAQHCLESRGPAELLPSCQCTLQWINDVHESTVMS